MKKMILAAMAVVVSAIYFNSFSTDLELGTTAAPWIQVNNDGNIWFHVSTPSSGYSFFYLSVADINQSNYLSLLLTAKAKSWNIGGVFTTSDPLLIGPDIWAMKMLLLNVQ
jgi:hypothetical protein